MSQSAQAIANLALPKSQQVKKIQKAEKQRIKKRMRRRLGRLGPNNKFSKALASMKPIIDRFGRISGTKGLPRPAKGVYHGPFSTNTKAIDLINRLKNTEINYYQALLDPEYACINHIPVSFPSPIPLCTKTVCMKNTFSVGVNNYGCALISWRPGTLVDNSFIERLKSYIQAKNPSEAHIRDEAQYQYSTLTVQHDNSLDGETLNGNGVFQPFKNFDVPILKSRLISAKMVITYNGKAIDEAGSIISGQYVGGLRGASVFATPLTDSGHTTPCHIMGLGAEDVSKEYEQFTKFDNILTLNYSNKEPLLKGKKYSFLYYPFDPLNKCFLETGAFGITENAVDQQKLPVSNPAIAARVSYINTQDGIHYNCAIGTGGTAYGTGNYTTSSSTSDPITNPVYFVAFQNVTAGQNQIEVNIYENFECIMSQDSNMIASAKVEPINPKIAMSASKIMMDEFGPKPSKPITIAKINQAINRARYTMDELGFIPSSYSSIGDL